MLTIYIISIFSYISSSCHSCRGDHVRVPAIPHGKLLWEYCREYNRNIILSYSQMSHYILDLTRKRHSRTAWRTVRDIRDYIVLYCIVLYCIYTRKRHSRTTGGEQSESVLAPERESQREECMCVPVCALVHAREREEVCACAREVRARIRVCVFEFSCMCEGRERWTRRRARALQLDGSRRMRKAAMIDM